MPVPKAGEVPDPIVTKVDPISGHVVVECNGVAVLCAKDGTFAIRDVNGCIVKTTVQEGIPTMQFSAPRLQFYSVFTPEFLVQQPPETAPGEAIP